MSALKFTTLALVLLFCCKNAKSSDHSNPTSCFLQEGPKGLEAVCGGKPKPLTDLCTVNQTETGAEIRCQDGSAAQLKNGKDGPQGISGSQGPRGQDGANGHDGRDGTGGRTVKEMKTCITSFHDADPTKNAEVQFRVMTFSDDVRESFLQVVAEHDGEFGIYVNSGIYFKGSEYYDLVPVDVHDYSAKLVFGGDAYIRDRKNGSFSSFHCTTGLHKRESSN